MKISKKGIELIKEFEGCKLTAYQDEVGVWTIGYGITNADKSVTKTTIKKGLKITKDKAEEWLEAVLNKLYAPKIMKYDVRYNWNQNEFDAMVSFAYNIGSIDQLTANGSRSKSVISNKLLEYNKAGGKVYNGLTRRRKAERELFLTPVPKPEPEEEGRREPGVSYFSELKNKAVSNITEFLHNRGLGAGQPNLSKIASLNADSPEVKAALFALAQKGILKKPGGLNKWKK
mgnify:FL=1